jgi:hypothetical protein
MKEPMPLRLEAVDSASRAFPDSWRDAAIRVLWNVDKGGVECPLCGLVSRGLAELRRLEADHILP